MYEYKHRCQAVKRNYPNVIQYKKIFARGPGNQSQPGIGTVVNMTSPNESVSKSNLVNILLRIKQRNSWVKVLECRYPFTL
jgi:hypothetical protein